MITLLRVYSFRAFLCTFFTWCSIDVIYILRFQVSSDCVIHRQQIVLFFRGVVWIMAPGNDDVSEILVLDYALKACSSWVNLYYY